MSRLRVAIVTPTLDTGGSERQIANIAAAIDHEAVELTIVVLFGAYKHHLLDSIDKRVSIVRPRFFHHDPRMGRWLADVLEQRRIDVVHSFLWNADAYSAAAKRRGGRFALICSERGDRTLDAWTPVRAFHPLLDRRLIFPAADLFCANSEFGRDVVVRRGFPIERTRVIPNGIDSDRIDAIAAIDVRALRGWPASDLLAGTVSRLVGYKGIDVLLRAVSMLDGVRCAIVGDGPQRRELERLAHTLGLDDRVAFLGRQAVPEAMVKSFDVFALPTLESEHASNAIIEAMTCAKPVVATRVGGNGEIVIDGKTGLLVAPRSPADLADALRRLRDDAALRSSFGAAGRAAVEERFRVDVIARRMVELWRSAAK